MWSSQHNSSMRRRAHVSRPASSLLDERVNLQSYDHSKTFSARCKHVICMNFLIFLVLCICSGIFTFQANISSTSRRVHKQYTEDRSNKVSSTSLFRSSNWRLRRLSPEETGKRRRQKSYKSSSTSEPSSSQLPVSSTHVPQRPPPRFIPGTLPQSKDISTAPLAAKFAALDDASASAERSEGVRTAPMTKSNRDIKKVSGRKKLLNSLTSSIDARSETDASEVHTGEAQMTSAPPPVEMKEEEPLFTHEDVVPIQCTSHEMSRTMDFAISQVEDGDVNCVDATDSEEHLLSVEDVAMQAPDEYTSGEALASPHSPSSLCPLASSWIGSGNGPQREDKHVSESFELPSEAIRDAVTAGEILEILESTTELEEVDIPESGSASVRDPLDYIPPFALEEIACVDMISWNA
ncbi:hypothetical protein Naga_100143g4 [Nannochloropsis gaditana]|uniref:Uncharacterized protein n=1 Tax=Nannochloropsis gaditana TaxID=72520 RepID=W7TQQ0_9STRA|nr:hypothetical protein Naga_100143g4 [Nannochloropsis gaditana]